MKLLLDEMLAPAIARELRGRGHDAEAMAGRRDCEALSDPKILAVARSEHRALVTDNLRDLRPLHAEAITPGGPGHYGMIFIPGGFRKREQMLARSSPRSKAVLAAHPGKQTTLTARHGSNKRQFRWPAARANPRAAKHARLRSCVQSAQIHN